MLRSTNEPGRVINRHSLVHTPEKGVYNGHLLSESENLNVKTCPHHVVAF